VRNYTYAGENLKISPYADMPRTMRPGGLFEYQVQELISSITPWEDGDDPIETMEFDIPIHPMALPRGYAVVTWGVHRGHRAKNPGLSPFVTRGTPHELMGIITVELKGTPESPLLTRAYGGDYTPPLPWMTSAKEAPDGVQECRDYWQTHAFLMRSSSLIAAGTLTKTPPEWFTRQEMQSNSH
jgi:hypothetical protein